MMFQEPKVEFIPVEDLGTTDDITSNGQETHMCSGGAYQPDVVECSADPSMF